MNDFVTMLRIRIKKADDQYIANASRYAWDPDPNSAEQKALRTQYFSLQNTDESDSTLAYHGVFILDKNGVCLRGEAFDYREPAPEPNAE